MSGGSANEKRIEGFFGVSGFGKSARVKMTLYAEKPKRLMVWDPKHEYGEFGQITDKMGAVNRAVEGKAAFRVVFQPHERHRTRETLEVLFSAFCDIAQGAKGLHMVADELHLVTRPGWAPEGWQRLTTGGRHEAITIFAASQSPATIDKSFFRTCSRLWAFMQGDATDADRMAEHITLTKEERNAARLHLVQLAPHECFRLTRYPRAVEKITPTKAELKRVFGG